MTIIRSKIASRASSLMLVLWAIMMMSFAVLGLVSNLSRGLEESIHAEKDFRARLLLQSARVLAGHPEIEWGDPLLRQEVSSSSSYDVSINTEGERLALNQLATSPVQREFARRLFEKWGMETKEARTLIDSIADWIDPGDRPRDHGAERDHYAKAGRPDFPFNRPLTDIDDVLLIRGSDELIRANPDWRSRVTLYGDGTIDVLRASEEMLVTLFDVTPSEMRRFITARVGPDGIADTIDDPRYKTIAEVRALLDVPGPNYNAVSTLLTLRHPITRVECHVRAGDLHRRMTIVSGPGLLKISEQ
jgi:type II secretory pathway component PulK